MRCKYTKFSYCANRSETFFFDLIISVLVYLLKIVEKNDMLISLNDRFLNQNIFNANSFLSLNRCL